MHIPLRKVVTGLTFAALSSCAQAPELDEMAFQVSDGPGADAAPLADAGVQLDAGFVGAPGAIGGGVVPGFDAGGQLPSLGGGASGGIGAGLGGIDSGSGRDAATGVSPVLDARVGPTPDAASTDGAQGAPEAGGGTTGGGTSGGGTSGGGTTGGGTTGGGTTGGGTTGGGTPGGGTPGGGAMCNPATCNNECLLLERCCDANNQCACLTPLSRQCTLPSL
jgi:hypothetical protein